DVVEQRLEASSVRLLCLGQRLEPVGDLGEALFARRLGHARVHVGVLVGLASYRRLEVARRVADGKIRRRIADLLEVVQMPVGMSGFALSGLSEVARDLG